MNRNKIKMEALNNAPSIPFVIATLLGTIKKPKLTNVTTGCFVGKYHRNTVNKTTVAPSDTRRETAERHLHLNHRTWE